MFIHFFYDDSICRNSNCLHFANFYYTFAVMNIIVKRTILFYVAQYPQAKTSLLTWYQEFSRQGFKNFNELKSVYSSASLVGQGRVIFNIKGNDFRLIVSINFRHQAAYIIWFGTHKDYNKINTETIKFNPRILTYKTLRK